MKVQIKHQTMQEVDFEFPSYYKAQWIDDTNVYFAMYSPEKCGTLYSRGMYLEHTADYVIPKIETYNATPITSEEFREELTKSFNSIILQTY